MPGCLVVTACVLRITAGASSLAQALVALGSKMQEARSRMRTPVIASEAKQSLFWDCAACSEPVLGLLRLPSAASQ